MSELVTNRVRCLLGHEPVHRQLAAGDGDETVDAIGRVIEDPVPARQLVFVAAPLEEGRPHTGGRAHRTELANRGEDALETLQQVVDLVPHYRDRTDVAVEVVVE